MKYQFYAIIFDVAGNQVNSKSISSPLSITSAIQLVTSVSINPSSAQTKNIGETFTITATVGPSNANNKNVNWTSSNTSVATVSKTSTTSGTAVTVTCKAAGTATITATATDGSGKSVSLSLTVINPITALSLNKDQTTLQKSGASTTVTATVTPSSYTNVEWTISNTSIATITTNGTTVTIKPNATTGTATLTAKAGSITKTCTVNVVNFAGATYSYTGNVQNVTLPAGTYQFECWGAQGGKWEFATGSQSNSINWLPGLGAYAKSIYTFNTETTIKILVGGQGTTGGGGGGSFVATNTNTPICVAGGGAGASSYGNSSITCGQSTTNGGNGGNGGIGGTSGGAGIMTNDNCIPGAGFYGTPIMVMNRYFNTLNDVMPSSFISGGTGGKIKSSETTISASYSYNGWTSTGGFGGGAPGWTDNQPRYGAGGGYSGGGGGSYGNYYSGGGGSYYIGTGGTSKAGNVSFPNVTGTGNEIGHSGNGIVKIMLVN